MKDVRGMVDRVAAAGTAQEVTAKLQDFYDAGVRHFVFLPVTAGATQRPVLDRLFAEVCRYYANTLAACPEWVTEKSAGPQLAFLVVRRGAGFVRSTSLETPGSFRILKLTLISRSM